MLGGIQYAVTAAIAIGFARRIGSPAALAFIPALGALTGGSFLHGYDLLLAVPAALIFWDQRPMIAALAVVAVSPHGPEVGGMIAACTAIVSAAVLVAAASRGRYGAVAALSLAIVLITSQQPSRTTKKGAMTEPSPSSYAERSWSEWESHNVRSAQWPLTIVPSCAGTIALCVLAVRRRIRYGTLTTMTNPASPSASPVEVTQQAARPQLYQDGGSGFAEATERGSHVPREGERCARRAHERPRDPRGVDRPVGANRALERRQIA